MKSGLMTVRHLVCPFRIATGPRRAYNSWTYLADIWGISRFVTRHTRDAPISVLEVEGRLLASWQLEGATSCQISDSSFSISSRRRG